MAGSRTGHVVRMLQLDHRCRFLRFPYSSILSLLSQGVPYIGTSCRLHGGSVTQPSYSPRAHTYYYGEGMHRHATSFEKTHYQRDNEEAPFSRLCCQALCQSHRVQECNITHDE